MGGRGVYPGSFNPPTVAHLAIARTARERFRLDSIDLSVSRVALAKETVDHPRFEDRIAVLREVAAQEEGLDVVVTEAGLLSDIAADYELLIVGADKWAQIQEPHWYGSTTARDAAMAALPAIAVVPRSGFDVPAELLLHVDGYHDVSSTRARNGDHSVMAPAAARFARRTGAWIDPDRYDRWAAVQPDSENDR